jgi:hypothetical protein
VFAQGNRLRLRRVNPNRTALEGRDDSLGLLDFDRQGLRVPRDDFIAIFDFPKLSHPRQL